MTVARARGSRGTMPTMRDTIGLMMKARSQARKNVSRVSAKNDRNVAAWAEDDEEERQGGQHEDDPDEPGVPSDGLDLLHDSSLRGSWLVRA